MASNASSVVILRLGLALTLAFVSGCAGDDQGISVLTEPQETVTAALVDGELAIDADGCVRISGDYAVWPKGTQRTDDGVDVNDRRLLFGERITGSGDFLDQESAAALMGLDAAYEMERCTDRDEEVAVLMLIE